MSDESKTDNAGRKDWENTMIVFLFFFTDKSVATNPVKKKYIYIYPHRAQNPV